MTDLTLPIYNDAEASREHLEAIRWPDGPVCPHCGVAEGATKLTGAKHRPGLYQCNDCREQFTVTVGTVFERSHVPLHKWVLATHLLSASKKGISSHQLHRMLGVTYKTAWFMAHRIREAMKDENPPPLGGEGKTIEADETFIGPKQAIVYDEKIDKRRRIGPEKRKVVTLVERGGRAKSVKVEDLSAETVRGVLVRNASRKSKLMTDEAGIYISVGREFVSHDAVNHSVGEYGRGAIHTNTVEGFFSIFKRGMTGIYQHCGEQHLQRYLHEFDFRYNNRKISDDERAREALAGAEGKRLTYRRSD